MKIFNKIFKRKKRRADLFECSLGFHDSEWVLYHLAQPVEDSDNICHFCIILRCKRCGARAQKGILHDDSKLGVIRVSLYNEDHESSPSKKSMGEFVLKDYDEDRIVRNWAK